MEVRHAAAVTAAALLLGSLTGCDASEEGSPARQAHPSTPDTAAPSPSPSTTASQDPIAALPAVPDVRRTSAVATQIGTVAAVLADPGARPRDVRRAGEFEQLAARSLAAAPEGVRRAVLARLDPVVRAKTRADVEAAALLDAMGPPQDSLPDWRIVEPPVPEVLLGHYRFAARRIGVPWSYLAAIHLVETRMGRIRGVSSAGALGPMQFLPTTWDLYGEGGDINEPRDAILAAARLLEANGAPGDMAGALWHYNPSDNYVGAVTRYAEQMQRSAPSYRGYWHWRVLYKHVRGSYVLDHGYPKQPAELLR